MSDNSCFAAAVALGLCLCACSSDPANPTTEPDPPLPACWTGDADGPGYGTRDEAVWQEIVDVAGTADDGPFYMLNVMKFREQACYRDGRETDLTGLEADALYSPIAELGEIGAAPVFVAEEQQTLLGDGTVWDRVAIVRYPSREALLTMTEAPAFQDKLVHKDASLEKSFVMLSNLLPSQLPDDFEPGDSPYPPTAEDPSVDMIHVIQFHDEAQYPAGSGEPPRSGQEAVALYEQAAAEVALELGVYPLAWFEVTGVLVGDGRPWDQLRINRMPSGAAFNALVADPRRQEGMVHRDAGIEDTYSFLVAPNFDTLGPAD